MMAVHMGVNLDTSLSLSLSFSPSLSIRFCSPKTVFLQFLKRSAASDVGIVKNYVTNACKCWVLSR